MRRLLAISFLCATSAYTNAQSAPLGDQPPAETRVIPYTGEIAPCDDPGVLSQIKSKFADREAQFWSSELTITEIDSARETGYRTTGASFIPRRYCQAEAQFSDGKKRAVVYRIGESLGFLGWGDGMTWCVRGLDRNHAFAPDCQTIGP